MSDALDRAQSVVEDAMTELFELEQLMRQMQRYRQTNNFLEAFANAEKRLDTVRQELQRAVQIATQQTD